ncbi:MAG: CvpA family protein [Sphingomonadaceae bacterium]|jgi:membrane protein required for colicin V production
MTALDMALLLLMGGMAVTGFMRGFVQEVLSLVAWGVAVIAVRLFLAPVTDLAGLWIGAGAAASLLSFVGLFALTFVAGKFVAGRVGDGVRSSLIGPVDRVLGAGFGALKGLVVATLAFLAFSLGYHFFFGGQGGLPQWIEKSRSFPLLNASGEAMAQVIHDRTSTKQDADEETENRSLDDEENAV